MYLQIDIMLVDVEDFYCYPPVLVKTMVWITILFIIKIQIILPTSKKVIVF
jgi:hypothetical protein